MASVSDGGQVRTGRVAVYFMSAAFGSFALGALMGQFVRLPGLSAVCDNAVVFSAFCIAVAVWTCFAIQLFLYRTSKELRLLGAELRQGIMSC